MKNKQQRIGILTLPLLANYGGILQAAALQHAIRRLGGTAVNISYALPSVLNTWHIRGKARKILLPLMLRLGVFKHLFRLYNCRRIPMWIIRRLKLRSMQLARRGASQRSFIRQHIKESPYCAYPISPRDFRKLNICACVTGSDQVWRYAYVPDKRLFFCAFAPPEIRKRSISYAASFGVDTWEWPEDLTVVCRALAQEFKAHSVREESGISLCAGQLGVEARWMPDPTFLLNREEYRSFIRQCQEAPLQKPADYIAYYILDLTPAKQQQLEELSLRTGLPLVNCMYDLPLEELDQGERSYFRPIEHWLDIIANARQMVTDSFHGSVFSIIFNTDFICYGNEGRGNSRFDSLLGKLGLMHRLVSADCAMQELPPITNWDEINRTLSEWQQRGLHYLKSNLNL